MSHRTAVYQTLPIAQPTTPTPIVSHAARSARIVMPRIRHAGPEPASTTLEPHFSSSHDNGPASNFASAWSAQAASRTPSAPSPHRAWRHPGSVASSVIVAVFGATASTLRSNRGSRRISGPQTGVPLLHTARERTRRTYPPPPTLALWTRPADA